MTGASTFKGGGTVVSALMTSALGCVLALTGCSSPKAMRQQAYADSHQLTFTRQPYQTYLLASPHPSLFVEVDAVEGYSPSDKTLDRLREFLATHCRKPGGIQVVRSDVIPLKEAMGVLPSALARKYLNGPPQNFGGAPPAFLYVLFYSDVLSDRPAVRETGHVGARMAAPPLRLENRNPHFDVLPYPAMIYMNVHWGPRSLHAAALLHEAGHALGLAFRTNNASAGHCQSRSCLMTPSLHLVRYLLGSDPGIEERLCEDCLAQLTQSRAQPPSSNLRFVGPVLVRSEPGYEVLSLPHRAKVVLGAVTEQECQEYAAAVRAEVPSPTDHESEWRVDASGKDIMLDEPTRLRELLTRIKADPDPMVRRVAPRLWGACAGSYLARGQFTNAVEACRQAIRADPDDYQGYNLLAWMKATCSDPSVRDGKEAVAAATKACELTRWREWNWIDTLAAACAETGDFRRALHFEAQALRTGKPSESEKKDMRERMALYQQSQPFREKR